MDNASATIYTDENLDHGLRAQIVERLSASAGVITCGLHVEKRHILIVEYHANEVTGHDLLQMVLGADAHAKMVG